MRPNLAAEKRRTPKKSFSGNEARAFVRAFLRLHFYYSRVCSDEITAGDTIVSGLL
jgi:hypothetical protein